MSTISVANRFADVVLALEQASRSRVRPTRIQLQKFVYLTDALAQIVGSLGPMEGHKTFRNGPYDAAIQNAVDCLCFRGVAAIAGTWRTQAGHLATTYTLTRSGRDFLLKIHESDAFRRRVEIAKLVGTELQNLGWHRIVDLVYAEPTYVSARPKGWGERLVPEDGLSTSAAFVLAVVRRIVSALALEGVTGDREGWVVNRFFAFLSDYDNEHGAKVAKHVSKDAAVS